MMLDKIAAFYLAQVIGIGPKGKGLICDIFGSELNLYLSSESEIRARINTYRYTWRHDIKNNDNTSNKRMRFISQKVIDLLLDMSKKIDIHNSYKKLSKRGIIFLRRDDDEFPDKLRHIPDAPNQLFIKGMIPDDTKAIGIVGARDCTPYGRDMARMFGYRLAKAGVVIVSGMALGIDGWSHRGALEAGGITYAVLGSGVDVCHPPSHKKLYEEIIRQGSVISEFPTYTTPYPSNFPLRNRIISGLSDGILVVEARVRSGSLITADAALEQGKDVFVIPGRIGDELSVGCNRLIRQGAIPVLSPDDILEYYSIRIKYDDDAPKLSDDERQIYDMIRQTPVSLSYIAGRAQGPYSNTVKLVMGLKRNSYIREVAKDMYIRV